MSVVVTGISSTKEEVLNQNNDNIGDSLLLIMVLLQTTLTPIARLHGHMLLLHSKDLCISRYDGKGKSFVSKIACDKNHYNILHSKNSIVQSNLSKSGLDEASEVQ